MAMPRWRHATWAFLIFNVVMVGIVLLVLWSVLDLSSSCDHLPSGPEYANDHTACTMGAGLGAAVRFWLWMLAVAIIWPIGLIVIAIAWLKGRDVRGGHMPRPTGQPRPRITRTHEGSNADSVFAAAASNVARFQTAGLSLVEAAWITKPTDDAGDLFRLGVAFGNRGIGFERIWPAEANVMEAVLARVPAPLEGEGPQADG